MKKDMSRLNSVFAIIICLLILSATVTSAASSTLMTYKGTGIRAKESVNSFSLSSKSKFYIEHTTSGWNATPKNPLTVTIKVQKKGAILYNDTGDSFSLKGLGTKTVSFTKDKGKYRLYFSINDMQYTANISGKVYK